MNKIALFKPEKWSLTGWLICLITRCSYSHAAVYVDGLGWFHSSETVGYFDVLNRAEFAEREALVFEFSGDLSGWLKLMKRTEYDWKGVLGWLFKADDKDRFYCFETAMNALSYGGIAHYNGQVSGCTVASFASSGVRSGKFKELM